MQLPNCWKNTEGTSSKIYMSMQEDSFTNKIPFNWSVCVRWLVIAYNTAISVTGSRVTVICDCQMAGDCPQHCHQCHWQQGDRDLCQMAGDCLQHCHQCHWQQGDRDLCQMAGYCLQHCHQWQEGDCDLCLSDGWWHAADYLQHCHQCHWLWSVCATGAGDLPISTWGGSARPAHLQVPRHWTQPGRWGRDHRQHSCQSVCQICLQQVSQQHHTCWQSVQFWVLAIFVNLLSEFFVSISAHKLYRVCLWVEYSSKYLGSRGVWGGGGWLGGGGTSKTNLLEKGCIFSCYLMFILFQWFCVINVLFTFQFVQYRFSLRGLHIFRLRLSQKIMVECLFACWMTLLI